MDEYNTGKGFRSIGKCVIVDRTLDLEGVTEGLAHNQRAKVRIQGSLVITLYAVFAVSTPKKSKHRTLPAHDYNPHWL